MPRRRTVVLASAATLLALGGLLAAGITAVTQTSWGREQIRVRVLGLINSKIQGTMYIGRIDGSLFTDVVIDSFAIRDRQDSVFVATGPIHIRFDPRDRIVHLLKHGHLRPSVLGPTLLGIVAGHRFGLSVALGRDPVRFDALGHHKVPNGFRAVVAQGEVRYIGTHVIRVATQFNAQCGVRP